LVRMRGRDADPHADGRAGATCRRQVPTSIRQKYPLRATEKVVYTAYTSITTILLGRRIRSDINRQAKLRVLLPYVG
jgi:hypothetical protein